MAKRKFRAITPQPEARRPWGVVDGQQTYQKQERFIRSHQVGALPILNHILDRMRLGEFLSQHVPADPRDRVPTPSVLLLVVKNLLVSREPMYGVVEWASQFGPWLFDLWSEDLEHLNDDRVGRDLERLFSALSKNLIMDVVTHVVREFDVRLDELHNDSTSVSVHGAYRDAQKEQRIKGQPVPAITWGHSKDHRPDLKQLLYILTVSDDGGVPIYFQTDSGNVVDDQTHQATWKVLAELVKRPDFVYVADCKLATTENMKEIASQGGRFITVLPATRKENTLFRQRLREEPQLVPWQEVYRLTNEDGSLHDLFQVCTQEQRSKDGFRLLWFHSLGKQETDAACRLNRIQRAIRELTDLRKRLQSPRTRFRQRSKVESAVQEILAKRDVAQLLKVDIRERQINTFRQTGRGRPGKHTKYTRETQTRFDISWTILQQQLDQAAEGDGVFPLITNIHDWTPAEILQAYKRQPCIEKRFSQFKNDFRVAPVYLKNVDRIVGLLAVYFFALMVQALLERELRRVMNQQRLKSLPLYPEGRACRQPTTRKIIDVFEPICQHSLHTPGSDEPEIFTTELAPIHRTILTLLGIPLRHYCS